MEDAPTFGEAAIVSPDRISAMNALALASDLLASAQERYARNDFSGAFEDSLNSVRAASAALLMQDGYVGDSLDATTAFLQKRYPGIFPVEEWLRLENTPIENGPGLYNMIFSAMGKFKKSREQVARQAIRVAGVFISAAQSEMGL
ncbi:hypothetical protein L0Y65_01605 [Candidatus Micrarchaeota archaeon]|nr:hypothetical protein [Candidatus Micrarchaeota archaeon]